MYLLWYTVFVIISTYFVNCDGRIPNLTSSYANIDIIEKMNKTSKTNNSTKNPKIYLSNKDATPNIYNTVVTVEVTTEVNNGSTTITPLNENISNETITTSTEIEKVTVEIYYESLCGFSVKFLVNKLEPIIPSMHKYLNIRLYPYGNAYTTEVNGQYEISCQHGESECYGNKLHACAIDILQNVTKSSLFICCLSDWNSNDNGVDECAKWLKFDGNPIKACAKSDQGHQLLKYYGDESNKMYYMGVPHVLVNGVSSRHDFKRKVCRAFKQPPPPCNNVTLTNDNAEDK